jgi:predicted RecA/RadA family phage recombinase
MPEATYYKPGETLDYTAGAALTDGQVVENAGVPGIVAGDVAASGDAAVEQVDGVVKFAKVTGAITVGTTLYWDEDGDPVGGTTGAGAATATASSGDFLLGVAVLAAASGDKTVKILLTGQSDQLCRTFGAAGGAVAQGLLGGAGTNASPATTAVADKCFLDFRVQSTATTGTARGIYVKLLLGAATGGEALRAFTECSSNTPVDTVNGAHISLQFGASAGNVTGLATAARCTLMAPDRALTGTVAAVMAELWADGASSAATGCRLSFLRACLGGNATGLAALEDYANLIEVAGGTNASGNVVGALNGNEPTWTGHTGLIRVCLNGTTAYLVAITL